jgi:hypothetical protein
MTRSRRFWTRSRAGAGRSGCRPGERRPAPESSGVQPSAGLRPGRFQSPCRKPMSKAHVESPSRKPKSKAQVESPSRKPISAVLAPNAPRFIGNARYRNDRLFCDAPRHAGPAFAGAGSGRHPQLFFVAARNAVDTGIRRCHDACSASGSIFRIPGITMPWLRTLVSCCDATTRSTG